MNPFRRSPRGEAPDTDRPDGHFINRVDAASWMADRSADLLADAEQSSMSDESPAMASMFASMSTAYAELAVANLALGGLGVEDPALWPGYFVPKPQDDAS